MGFKGLNPQHLPSGEAWDTGDPVGGDVCSESGDVCSEGGDVGITGALRIPKPQQKLASF